MKHSVKRVKSKQLGHMNVIAKLVKEVETLISDRNDFSKKDNISCESGKEKVVRFQGSNGKIR